MPLTQRQFAECDLCGKRGPESYTYSGAIADATDAGWIIDTNYNTQRIVTTICPDCVKTKPERSTPPEWSTPGSLGDY